MTCVLCAWLGRPDPDPGSELCRAHEGTIADAEIRQLSNAGDRTHVDALLRGERVAAVSLSLSHLQEAHGRFVVDSLVATFASGRRLLVLGSSAMDWYVLERGPRADFPTTNATGAVELVLRGAVYTADELQERHREAALQRLVGATIDGVGFEYPDPLVTTDRGTLRISSPIVEPESETLAFEWRD